MRKSLLLLFLSGFLLLVVVGAVSAQRSARDTTVYLPIAARAPAPSCQIPGTSYTTLPISGAPTGIPAATHPDLNLAIRGYVPVNAPLELVNYAGNSDPKAPQLATLFAPERLPIFSRAYQVYKWDWTCNCRGELNSRWPTTLLGMRVHPGEVIHVPDSGYDIGGGYDVLVLYATERRITLKYTREDNVVYGYTVHVENVCVEPDLLALYRQQNAAGRRQLPALRGNQPFARARGYEIKVAIRDSGTFLDPRSQKDWWQDYPLP